MSVMNKTTTNPPHKKKRDFSHPETNHAIYDASPPEALDRKQNTKFTLAHLIGFLA